MKVIIEKRRAHQIDIYVFITLPSRDKHSSAKSRLVSSAA